MIIDKKKPQEIEEPIVNQFPPDITIDSNDEPELWEHNPMSEIFYLVRDILRSIPLDSKDPDSPPLFRTVKLNYGQLTRIKHDKHNYEYALAFPAAFLHFINVRWLTQTARIGEGRAELRICYVLNRLNNGDDEYQTEGFDVFQKINQAINDYKSKLPAFTQRFQLTYWDQVENFDEGLQQYWITYEVWFKDYSTYQYQNYVEKYVVIPPFTNHSDQLPSSNPDNHDDHDDPTIEDAAQLID